MNTRTIAAFDFDGTFITKDSFILFFRKNRAIFNFYKVFIKHLPDLIAMKLNKRANDLVKEKVLTSFLNGFSKDEFEKLCNSFSPEIEAHLNQEAFNKFKWHREQGHSVVIISASPENWIIPWANKLGIEVISTKLDVVNNKLTGKLASPNCYGQEKVNRLLNRFPNRGSYELYAYGDSSGDKELLELADHAFYKSF